MIKDRTGDFRVTEQLADGYIVPKGRFSVYRVQKRKLTSFEAANELADLANVPREAVSFAGLKDRQGVTIQYMSVEGGKPVSLSSGQLRIELVGRAQTKIDSSHSLGNEFEVSVRDVPAGEVESMRAAATISRECGIPNYFDEQRFGNLRHGQGWIARDLMMGRKEEALKRLLCSTSQHDDPRTATLKRAMREEWRDWKKCRDIAGKLGAHHSVFEHLGKDPRDYIGAFGRIASRIRTIHLFAYQSHIWNRVAVEFLRERLSTEPCLEVSGLEGPLLFAAGRFQVTQGQDYTLRLPGPHLADVKDAQHKRIFERVLHSEGLSPRSFNIEGIPGFALKGEDRALFIYPDIAPIRGERDKRSASAYSKREGSDLVTVKLRFALPRGAYATVVVKRLIAKEKRNHAWGSGSRKPDAPSNPKQKPKRNPFHD